MTGWILRVNNFKYLVNEREKAPSKTWGVGWDRIRVRGYFIKNIIIHSVNNILILLSIINSVNVKNNNNNKLQIANRKNTYYISIIFYVNTVYY